VARAMDLARERDSARWLVPLAFGAAAALCLVTAPTLFGHAPPFPAWFPPAFAAGTVALAGAAAGFAVAAARTSGGDAADPPSRRTAALAWTLVVASFPCTTSVHAFLPFSPRLVDEWGEVGPVLRLNFAVALAGVAGTLVLARQYFAGDRRRAVALLVGFALVWLVPNDDCANPFNDGWIERVGASPLMYVPNLLVAAFCACALRSLRPRLALALAAACCGAALVLGLGHTFGGLW